MSLRCFDKILICQDIMPLSSNVAHVVLGVMRAARPMSTACRPVASSLTPSPRASTMPPGFVATVGRLESFVLPDKVSGSVSDQAMAKAMIDAWRRDGILQVAMSPRQRRLYQSADASSRSFFRRSAGEKRACVDRRSYGGYIASGEEVMDGVADYSEIFTVTKDLSLRDQSVVRGWLCHGPCPWPDREMKAVMGRYMTDLSASGNKLLQLIEMGLRVPAGSLTKYTNDGWHQMRVLR